MYASICVDVCARWVFRGCALVRAYTSRVNFILNIAPSGVFWTCTSQITILNHYSTEPSRDQQYISTNNLQASDTLKQNAKLTKALRRWETVSWNTFAPEWIPPNPYLVNVYLHFIRRHLAPGVRGDRRPGHSGAPGTIALAKIIFSRSESTDTDFQRCCWIQSKIALSHRV